MKKIIFLNIFLFASVLAYAQEAENEIVSDSVSIDEDKKLSIDLDIVSRYLWRGQSWGGNYIAIQPTIEYEVVPNLIVGIWATTNFQKDHFYSDGISEYKGYQEIDFYLNYQLNDFLQVQLWEYYWPTVSKVEGVSNNFFNYKYDSVNTIDAILYFDFSEYKYPFNATISTLIAGNDYRYNELGENPKQNYTTYLELGYIFTPFNKSTKKCLKNIELYPTIGTVLNNNAEYYSYADYNKVSFTNLGFKLYKEFELGHNLKMPISLDYIYNGAINNTELFGRNFLVTTLSLSY